MKLLAIRTPPDEVVDEIFAQMGDNLKRIGWGQQLYPVEMCWALHLIKGCLSEAIDQ